MKSTKNAQFGAFFGNVLISNITELVSIFVCPTNSIVRNNQNSIKLHANSLPGITLSNIEQLHLAKTVPHAVFSPSTWQYEMCERFVGQTRTTHA